MKYRLAHWLSHGLTTPLTTSLSPPLLQCREEHRAALNHPLSLRERARVRGSFSSLRPLWLATLLLPLIAMIGSAQASDLGALLGGSNDSFKKVLPGQTIQLPEDHAAHPDYRSEWWYLTGNLKDEQGREYGMQWTLFRQGIEQALRTNNPWLTPQLWLAQFAITDLEHGSHRQDERASRQGPGLAG
ncbi:carotenoid 1,2-hydratase, partial [Aeromonas sp. HMWF036]|uniref:carotenoid 1,2-hydratase n=1 Tax=Aeromonas sp. HMWF036 TaxID=2056869 RepID=UPI00215A0581